MSAVVRHKYPSTLVHANTHKLGHTLLLCPSSPGLQSVRASPRPSGSVASFDWQQAVGMCGIKS